MTVVEHRTEIIKWARWGVANEKAIHYQEIRPMPLNNRLPLTTDCSGFVTLCYFLAGAPDPNGLNYNGQGYTGTLIGHGYQIILSKVHPGDVCILGPGNGDHAVIISDISNPLNPFVISHGEESGPEVRHLNDDPRSKRFFQYVTTTGK